MPGPGDWMAPSAGGRSRLRASDTDRDAAVDVLKAAFVQGRLARGEFDLRVGQVLAVRTYADLDALTASIPAGSPPQGHRRNLVAQNPPTSPSDHRSTRAFDLVAQAAWTRRRLLSLVAGLLLLVAGLTLPSTVVFIAGVLIVGLSAPQALPWTQQTATVRTWQWLYRRESTHA
jgi:Domain of unknown function (DUF1707)